MQQIQMSYIKNIETDWSKIVAKMTGRWLPLGVWQNPMNIYLLGAISRAQEKEKKKLR